MGRRAAVRPPNTHGQLVGNRPYPRVLRILWSSGEQNRHKPLGPKFRDDRTHRAHNGRCNALENFADHFTTGRSSVIHRRVSDSILTRCFRMVDHKYFNRAFGAFQSEPELFL